MDCSAQRTNACLDRNPNGADPTFPPETGGPGLAAGFFSATVSPAFSAETRMAIFIVLKRPGPPSREVLVNLDEILMVQPGQGTGSAILFGREHLVTFEEDLATIIRRIQTGPYIQANPTSATPK
jgi:hypothetical protein